MTSAAADRAAVTRAVLRLDRSGSGEPDRSPFVTGPRLRLRIPSPLSPAPLRPSWRLCAAPSRPSSSSARPRAASSAVCNWVRPSSLSGWLMGDGLRAESFVLFLGPFRGALFLERLGRLLLLLAFLVQTFTHGDPPLWGATVSRTPTWR